MARRRCSAQGVYVAVEDVDTHYEQAKAAGAEIIREIEDTDYGAREYTARDLEGHVWSFGSLPATRRDVTRTSPLWPAQP